MTNVFLFVDFKYTTNIKKSQLQITFFYSKKVITASMLISYASSAPATKRPPDVNANRTAPHPDLK
jgi:hypothetical protein